MTSTKPHRAKVFIGIDLAWGGKNASGFAVLDEQAKLLEHALLFCLNDIVHEVQKYINEYNVFIGVDAPLLVENESGNRAIEKAFLRDFSKYKIGMLPVNRKIMCKYSAIPRGEALRKKLEPFIDEDNLYEVYPHSTLAVLFNNNTILPYKRKTGRSLEMVKEALQRYQGFLKKVITRDELFECNLVEMKGKPLKNYEDRLDAITCAYTLVYFSKHKQKCKVYTEAKARFITPYMG